MKNFSFFSFLFFSFFGFLDAQTWSAVGTGMDSYVSCFAEHNGQLYAGGAFQNAGGIASGYLARWDGNNWSSPDGNYFGATVSGCMDLGALKSYNGSLYVLGNFVLGDAMNIVRWDGNGWYGLGSIWWAGSYRGLDGGGAYSWSRGSMEVYNNKLYIGGEFCGAGGWCSSNGISCITSWDGSSFGKVGPAGGNFCAGAGSYYGTVSITNVLTEHNGDLYVGGFFYETSSGCYERVAKYTGGTNQFSQMGTLGAINDWVFDLCFFNGELYATGMFPGNIVKWNSSASSWSIVGGGLGDAGLALCVYNGKLYVGGMFLAAGGNPASNIASWDGNTWSPVGTGTDGWVLSLQVWNGELYVGGWFNSAGGIANTIGIARLRTVATPVTLKSFSAETSGSEVFLHWTTVQEKDNYAYIIEKSPNGKFFFETASREGAGNSEKENHYSYADKNPFSGTSFYRLQFHGESEGAFEYSNIIEISIPITESIYIGTIYPNPVESALQFLVHSSDEINMHLEVSDMTGKIVQEKDIVLNRGENPVIWDLTILNKGFYMLKSVSEEGIQMKKFIKL